MSSVRFICGTQDIHKDIREKDIRILGTEDTILYAACFDANGGVFEPLFGEQDAIISDALNHASIIDGVRFARHSVSDMPMTIWMIWSQIKEAAGQEAVYVVTDGSFSIGWHHCAIGQVLFALAEKYDAAVMVDDSHSTGFIGKTGRRYARIQGVMGKIEFIQAHWARLWAAQAVDLLPAIKNIEMLRQRAVLTVQQYAGALHCGASIAVFDMFE